MEDIMHNIFFYHQFINTPVNHKIPDSENTDFEPQNAKTRETPLFFQFTHYSPIFLIR